MYINIYLYTSNMGSVITKPILTPQCTYCGKNNSMRDCGCGIIIINLIEILVPTKKNFHENKKITLNSREYTVEDLKKQINKENGIPIRFQHLFYKCKELQNEQILSNLNI